MRLKLDAINYLMIIFSLRGSEAKEPEIEGILTRDQISEERQSHVQRQIEKFHEEHGGFKSLPVYSRTKRPSSSCPGVEEEEILYKYNMFHVSDPDNISH